MALLESQPGLHFMGMWHRYGGITGGRARFPKSAPLLLARAKTTFGHAAVAWAERNDARLLALSLDSDALSAKLNAAKSLFSDKGQTEAYSFLYDHAGQYEFTYFTAVEGFKKAGPGALVIWEMILSGNVEELAAALIGGAEQSQAAADEKRRLFAERKLIGLTALGHTVARKENLFFSDNVIVTTALLRPHDGEADAAKAIAWARIAGRAAGVLGVKGRYYVYGLSENISYSDLWETDTFKGHRTRVVPSGGGGLIGIATSEGYLVKPRGQRFFGGALERRPHELLKGGLALVDERTEGMSNDELLTLYRRVALDTTLANLDDAEQRLRKERERVAPRGRLDPAVGASLRLNAGRLKQRLLRASALAIALDGKAPTVEQIEEAEAVLSDIGSITARDPSAAMMVKNDHDPDDKGPLKADEVKNRVEGKGDKDAAEEARDEIEKRLENVEKVRRYLIEHPDKPGKLQTVAALVMPRFPPEARGRVESAIFWEDLGTLARTLGLMVIEVGVLIAGLAAGGVPALVVGGGLAVIGAGRAIESFREARMLTAMTAVDVEGGVQLVDPRDAARARTWAWIGLALAALDLGLLGHGISHISRLRSVLATRDVAFIMQGSQRSIGEVARRLGMSERQIIRALETARGAERATLINQVREAAAVSLKGGRAGTGDWAWDLGRMADAERELAEQVRLATGTPAETALRQQLLDLQALRRVLPATAEPAAVEALRVAMMQKDDVGRVASTLRGLGVDIGRTDLQLVKRYNFDSPYLSFYADNFAAWWRLSTGRGTIDDARYIVHELAEIKELQRRGVDFLGKGFETMSRAERQAAKAAFDRAYIPDPLSSRPSAHQKALEAEYEWLAQQVSNATGGRNSFSREDRGRAAARAQAQARPVRASSRGDVRSQPAPPARAAASAPPLTGPGHRGLGAPRAPGRTGDLRARPRSRA